MRNAVASERRGHPPATGRGEGSAGDKFRVSGTQETVEGAGANEVSEVLSEASCCRSGESLSLAPTHDPASGAICATLAIRF